MPKAVTGRQLVPAGKTKQTARNRAPAQAPAEDPLVLKRDQFPTYRVEQVDRLLAYQGNARTHTPAQIDLLAKMITEFGWTNPVLVDGALGILAGHGRVLAAKQLGMTTVPVIELSHLSPAQRRAYVIADNQSALRAGWDEDLLRLELGALQSDGFDLGLTGFDPGELGLLFAGGGGQTDPDYVPPVEAVAVSRPGDVWLLGATVTCPHCARSQPVRR